MKKAPFREPLEAIHLQIAHLTGNQSSEFRKRTLVQFRMAQTNGGGRINENVELLNVELNQ